jgi:hypothetical protein
MKFTIKRNVRAFISKSDLRLGAGVIEELENKIEKILLKGIERAKNNNRATMMRVDL